MRVHEVQEQLTQSEDPLLFVVVEVAAVAAGAAIVAVVAAAAVVTLAAVAGTVGSIRLCKRTFLNVFGLIVQRTLRRPVTVKNEIFFLMQLARGWFGSGAVHLL